MADLILNSKTCQDLLTRLKSRIRTDQVRAAVAVTQELVLLYRGNTARPIGISEFRHVEKLPEQLKGTLSTIEEIEAELSKPVESPEV